MSALQTRPFERTILAKLGTAPVEGILPADVDCKFRKQGQTAFQIKVLDSTSWKSLGDGYYVLQFSPVDMDTLGSFWFSIDGLAFDEQMQEFTIESLPADIIAVPPDVCLVSGVIIDAGGNALKDILVTAKGLAWPYKSNANILADSFVDVRTDYLGQFQMRLVRGAKVLLEVEKTGIRAQVTVPDAASVLLSDLITFPLT
jgi:hypothetical protein